MVLFRTPRLNSHFFNKWLLFLFFVVIMPLNLEAHPMPNSIVQIKIEQKKIVLQLKLPVSELELAYGKSMNNDVATFVRENNNQLKQYIGTHIKLIDQTNHIWDKKVTSVSYDSANSEINGTYSETLATVEFESNTEINRNEKLLLLYDVIIHQVVTHSALVSITQDWENGIVNNKDKQIGVISLDTKNNVVRPFEINLEKGSIWKGFSNMFWLGVQHITEGTDHLLFLLVLLLPASLIVVNKKWINANNRKYTFMRLLKIVTAFTIGHSFTLILGALEILQLPSKPVEVLIALSIFITAIHCIKPMFYGKEIYIATGFGLVHGLAFATVLSNLHLQMKQMALSILGFNLGIEATQLCVVLVILPVLLVLSTKAYYDHLKNTGSIIAIILSIKWIIERLA